MLELIPSQGYPGCRRASIHTGQLAASLWATYLEYPVLRASTLFDLENLHNDILSALPSDPLAALHMSTSEPPDS